LKKKKSWSSQRTFNIKFYINSQVLLHSVVSLGWWSLCSMIPWTVLSDFLF